MGNWFNPPFGLFGLKSKLLFAQDNQAFRDDLAADAGGDFKLPERTDHSDFPSAEGDLIGGAHGTEKLHRADRREPEGAAWLAGGEARRLRERFGQDDAGHERVAGEMTGKEGFAGWKSLAALRAFAGHDGPHFIHKNKRRAMREAERDRIAQAHRVPSVGTK